MITRPRIGLFLPTLLVACAATEEATRPAEGRIVCSMLKGSTWQVVELDLETGAEVPWTTDSADKRYPSRGPRDGLVYHTSNQQAQELDRPGTSPVHVLQEYEPLRDVVFSDDGQRAVFSRIRTDVIDSSNLWLMDAAASEPRLLTTDVGIQGQPAWSPDGARIAYVGGTGYGTYEIYTLDLATKERARLTQNDSHEFFPAWSPDGKFIAFSSDAGGDYEIWVMNADGGEPKRLTHHAGLDSRPAWSPDGSSIAFTSRRDGKLSIWAVRSTGGEPFPLLSSGVEACDPLWR